MAGAGVWVLIRLVVGVGVMFAFHSPAIITTNWDHDGGGESGRRAAFAEWIIEDWLFDYEEYPSQPRM